MFMLCLIIRKKLTYTLTKYSKSSRQRESDNNEGWKDVYERDTDKKRLSTTSRNNNAMVDSFTSLHSTP